MKLATLGAILGLALVAQPAMAAPSTLVKVDAKTQARLGIVTAPLQSAYHSATAAGFARVLDPVPLATLDSDIATAASALAASQAEAARTKSLNAADQTVSKQAAEAAAAQARADAAKLLLLRRRVGLEWGPALARLSDVRRGKLIADIAAGRAALVRIDSASGLSQLTGSATLDLGAAGLIRAAILGPTRVGDPRLQSTGLLGLVSGREAIQLGAGTVAPATIAFGPGVTGVIIPRAALLRTGGQTYAYVRHDAGSFERRLVEGGSADPDGLFVSRGFQVGEPVVTVGAAQLFAAQSGPSKAD
jgi:hypothetical protein